MKNPEDRERLLNDILRDENAMGLREASFTQALSLARRRRRFRQGRNAAAVLTLLVALGILVWRPLQIGTLTVGPPAAPKPYALVRTQALPPARLVRTEPLSPRIILVSAANLNVITTSAAHPSLRELDDDELLAIAPALAVLVRYGPHAAQVVFPNPADREEFLRD